MNRLSIPLSEAVKQCRTDIGKRIPHSTMAHHLHMSSTAFSRLINRGEWPRKLSGSALTKSIEIMLRDGGVDPNRVEFPTPNLQIEAVGKEEELPMQLDRATLNLFGLRNNPFQNDVESDADVFRHKAYQDIEAAVRDAIEERGFLAICAESGAGKTTTWDTIEGEYGQRQDTVICRPQVASKEELNPDHLARCLIYNLLGESTKIKQNAEDRGRQLSRALRDSRSGTMDRKVVLVIDDAHFCTSSVLRQLKTFYEEKVGRYRLMAIILVGLPELKTKLAQFAEIGNRIRLIEVAPIPVRDYLEHKLQRAGSSVEKLFDEGGFKAFCERFPHAGRGPSLGRPLIINATCIRAMGKLAENGAQPGERITREIIDRLPGTHSIRRTA